MHRASGPRAIQNPDRINPAKTNFYSKSETPVIMSTPIVSKLDNLIFIKDFSCTEHKKQIISNSVQVRYCTERDISTLDLRIQVPNISSLLTCGRQSNMAYVVYRQVSCVFQPISVANSKSSLRSLTLKLKFQNIN